MAHDRIAHSHRGKRPQGGDRNACLDTFGLSSLRCFHRGDDEGAIVVGVAVAGDGVAGVVAVVVAGVDGDVATTKTPTTMSMTTVAAMTDDRALELAADCHWNRPQHSPYYLRPYATVAFRF